MHRRRSERGPVATRTLIGVVVVVAITVVVGIGPSRATDPATFTGSLPDGATYLIEAPTAWNGTLLLYSHRDVTPGSSNPAQDVGDPLSRRMAPR